MSSGTSLVRKDKSKPVPPLNSYSALLKQVRKTIAAGKLRAQKAVEREKVRTCWETGKLIHDHILLKKDRAEYGAKVFGRLSKDLSMSETEIKYMVELTRAFPIRPPAGELSWSHFRDLLSVNDAKERTALIRKAEAEHWKRPRLRAEIRKMKRSGDPRQKLSGMTNWKDAGMAGAGDSLDSGFRGNDIAGGGGAALPAGQAGLTMTGAGTGPVSVRRNDELAESRLDVPELGKLRDYPVIVAEDGPYQGKRVLDLGFSLHHSPAPKGRPVNNPEAWPFTYRVWLIRVIDGDTLWGRVELGFGITIKQRLRFRNINAAELPSREGEAAKRALVRLLKPAAKPGFLVLTTKSDQYDRYLADIFLEDGTYINQRMVELGHAVSR